MSKTIKINGDAYERTIAVPKIGDVVERLDAGTTHLVVEVLFEGINVDEGELFLRDHEYAVLRKVEVQKQKVSVGNPEHVLIGHDKEKDTYFIEVVDTDENVIERHTGYGTRQHAEHERGKLIKKIKAALVH